MGEVRTELKLNEVILMGLSCGGSWVAAYSLNPDVTGVRGLILCSPVLSTPRWEEDQRENISYLPKNLIDAIEHGEATKNYEGPYQEAMVEYYKRYLCTLDPWPDSIKEMLNKLNMDVYMHMWGPSEFTATGKLKTFDLSKDLHKISIPVLLLCGDRDEAGVKTMKDFQMMIPNSQLAVIPSAGHCSQIDQPEIFKVIIEQFLKKSGDNSVNNLEKERVKKFIASLGELQGEKVKLCDYYSDSESKKTLSKHYLEFDEESFNFYFLGTNLSNAEDILTYQKSLEAIENYKVFNIKDLEDKPVGQIGTQYFEPYNGINVSYVIAKDYWGNGYALDAVKTIMKSFYENRVNASILIGAEVENPKSLRVIEKLAENLGFENFDRNDKSKILMAPKYKLEQKSLTYECTYRIDEGNLNFVICSMKASGKKIQEDLKFLKRLINTQVIEKGYFEAEGQYVFITPIYNVLKGEL